MNEKYKFTIDKLVSIKEIIKNIEESNYIDGYLGYEDGFYRDSILYYLKENARLKDKLNKRHDLLNEPIFEYDNIPCNIENEIIQLKDILKEN